MTEQEEKWCLTAYTIALVGFAVVLLLVTYGFVWYHTDMVLIEAGREALIEGGRR